MTPERWQRIKTIFEAVDSAAPADRADLLDRLCDRDSDLRRDVEKVLGAGAATPLSPQPRDLAGRVLGPYQVVSLIGSGGMGDVYAAEDSRLGRPIALKLLPALHADDLERIRRFQQEARAASALNHPNIVTVHDFGQIDGLYYIATELVRGETLRALIARGRLPLREVVNIAVQVAGALATAHEAGIVHRDIKPANIMVRPDGYVKVLDFGLAKLRERNSSTALAASLTETGSVVGTTAYMSPEQARSLPIDARSDIFSFGIVLYEVLSGEPPFQGKTGADLIAALLQHEPKPLHSLVPAVPEALGAIVDRCLQKDRGQRYQTSQELLADLQQFQRDLDSQGRPSPLRSSGRSRKRVAAASGMVLAAVLLILVFRYFAFRDPGWYNTIRLTKVVGSGGISPSGRYLIYVTEFPNGTQSIHVRLLSAERGVEVVPPSPFRHYGISVSPDENYLYYTEDKLGEVGTSVLFRIPFLGGSPRKLLDDVRGVTISPDGSKFIFTREREGTVSLWTADPDGANPRQLLTSREYRSFYLARWSHDSREIYYSEASLGPSGVQWSLRSVGREGGSSRLVANLGKTQIMGFAALPDGSGFLANAIDPESNLPQIWRMSLTGEMHRITNDLNEYQGFSVTSDGKTIATNQAVRETELWIVDTGGSPAKSITEGVRYFGEPVWALGGQIVATLKLSGGVSNLWSMAPDGGGRQRLSVPGSLSETLPAACPDRDEVVFVSRRRGAVNIWRARPDGSEIRQLTFGINDNYPQCTAGGVVLYRSQVDNQTRTLQVSMDGGDPAPVNDTKWEQQISADGKLKLIEYADEKTHSGHKAIQTRDGARTLFSFAADVGGPAAWEPHGRSLAHVYRGGGTGEIWNQPLDGSAPRKLTNFGGKLIFSFDWSPDGRYIVCAVGRIVVDLVLIQDVR